jgi:hypothetical protein
MGKTRPAYPLRPFFPCCHRTTVFQQSARSSPSPKRPLSPATSQLPPLSSQPVLGTASSHHQLQSAPAHQSRHLERCYQAQSTSTRTRLFSCYLHAPGPRRPCVVQRTASGRHASCVLVPAVVAVVEAVRATFPPIMSAAVARRSSPGRISSPMDTKRNLVKAEGSYARRC